MKKYSLIEIQEKILEIAIYFDKLCKENKIDYYMMGGSALGAIRHEGFIPWDDDYDVFMTYNNYKKFLDVCKYKLDKKKYFLQKENTKEWPMFFSKLRLNGTTFLEEDTKHNKMHKGLFIDIMCLNNASSNIVYRYLQYLAARFITIKSLSERGYITKSKLKIFSIFLFKKIINKKVVIILLKFIRSLNKRNTGYVGHFFGRAKFKNTTFPIRYLGIPRYVKFSSTFLPVPSNAEKYLELRYGKKYMEMPDEKTKSLYPSHSVFVDLNNDYKIYE
tara:strand:+ start:3236 stop:4060 length:825 start_codon:yes stop_codon:yes gene_type:complete